jgi:hypothetical protein
MILGTEAGRVSGASGDDNLGKLRLSNVSETQKRIQRLFSLVYLVFFLVMLTWYNTNFEGSRLEEDIERLDKALEIEMLKPWDDFLERTASCFHSYFFGYGKGGVVTRAELKQYIEYYDSENKKAMGLVPLGLQRPWPVDEMRDLLDSEQQWRDCAFWAEQDTLVSFLFSMDVYLTRYFFERQRALYDAAVEDFWADTDSINVVVDSVLCSLGAQIDTLKKPFEYAVKVGWNPFVGGATTFRRTVWGRHWSFDQYSYFDLNGLLSKLQKLNHISRFKEVVIKHRDALLRAAGDLDKMLTRTVTRDSIRFSPEETDIRFHDLYTILSSELLASPDLPDTTQPRQICDLKCAEPARKDLGDELLEVYFPTYLQVLRDYNIDKVGGVKMLRNLLVSQRGSAKQKIHLLGAEISSRSILYFLPFFCLGLYLLTLLFIHHLRDLLQSDQKGVQLVSERSALATEALKAPLLVLIRPIWLGLILVLLPGLGTVSILVDQTISAGGRGILLNTYFVCVLVFAYLVVLIYVWRYTILLHQVTRENKQDSLEVLNKEQKSHPQNHGERASSSEPN